MLASARAPRQSLPLAAVVAALASLVIAGCAKATKVLGSSQTCTTCHGAPPAAPPAGFHPAVASDLRGCATCHPGTVDASGNLLPGGQHQDGRVEWVGGHPPGYASPGLHGRDFFEVVSGNGGLLLCTVCHGTDYDVAIANGRSCNSCHAAAGWASWQTSCSFCHGARSPATQAGYAFADHPAWAAPPDAISQRLTGAPAPDRAGAHQLHLAGSAFAGPFACSVCHQVPTTLGHIRGRDERAAVVLMPPGAAAPDPDGYDTVTRTCATACHGANRSPAWSFTGIQCDGCHGVPPSGAADPEGTHEGLDGTDLTQCAGCHPDTITGAGTINVAGGRHLNGMVDHVAGHASGFAVPSTHGPQFLNWVSGAPGSLDCTFCHGTSLGLCNWCHAQPASGGWAEWKSNCTFCHGTRTATYTGASLVAAAPPQDVAQRLTGGTLDPYRVGKHAAHLSSGAGYAALPCSSCHAVPAGVSEVGHVTTDRRAAVTLTALGAFPGLSPAQLLRLPVPFGTYDPSTHRCATYCHGSAAWGGATSGGIGLTPVWTTSGFANCTTCHGQPPPTGRAIPEDDLYCFDPTCSLHEWHLNMQSANFMDGCAACHSGNVHVNGVVDIGFLTPNGNPPVPVTGTWDAAAGTCAVSCHVSPGAPYSWR